MLNGAGKLFKRLNIESNVKQKEALAALKSPRIHSR